MPPPSYWNTPAGLGLGLWENSFRLQQCRTQVLERVCEARMVPIQDGSRLGNCLCLRACALLWFLEMRLPHEEAQAASWKVRDPCANHSAVSADSSTEKSFYIVQ